MLCNRAMASSSGLLLSVVALLATHANACTTVTVNASDGTTVIGRTMELGIPLTEKETNTLWSLVTTARGAQLGDQTLPLGFVAIAGAFHNESSLGLVAEGMNEKGLTVSVQTLRGAEYQKKNDDTPALKFTDVAPYLLGSCTVVGDVAAALAKVTVVDSEPMGDVMQRAHWSVADAAGSSLVVEYVGGALRLHENSRLGVLTNDPPFEWHLQHLDEFAGYDTREYQAAWGLEAVDVEGGATVPAVASHGLNTRMLPGGYTPPDRFVKMFLLRETAVAHERPKTADDAVAVAAGLVNTVHIVRGTVPKLSKVDGYEWTNWAVLKLPGKRQFLVRAYNDMQWRRVDVAALDFSGKAYTDVPLYRDLNAGIADVAF
jgi:choloylglycine hydrolase